MEFKLVEIKGKIYGKNNQQNEEDIKSSFIYEKVDKVDFNDNSFFTILE